jgi:hypothetical protein
MKDECEGMPEEFRIAQLSQVFFQMSAVASSEQAITDYMRQSAATICLLILKRMLKILGENNAD